MAKFDMMCKDGRVKFIGTHGNLWGAYRAGLADGDYTMAITKKKRGKSQDQLGYYYAVVIPCAVQALIDAGWDSVGETAWSLGGQDMTAIPLATNQDNVDSMLKALFSASEDSSLVQKRRMTVDEMGRLIDFAGRWLAESFGVVLPAPAYYEKG